MMEVWFSIQNMAELCIQMGIRLRTMVKNAKELDILAYFGTPGGLLKSEQFFKHDIFAHLGLF